MDIIYKIFPSAPVASAANISKESPNNTDATTSIALNNSTNLIVLFVAPPMKER